MGSYYVDFEPVGRRGECPAGGSLLDCARALGVDLVSVCGGAGTCGRCQVQVLAGAVTEPTARERETYTPAELAAGRRLACQTVPLSDCRVSVPPESLTAPQRTQVEGLEVAVRPEPPAAGWPTTGRALGLAVDLGTTKIAGYLVDMTSGQTLAAQGIMNPQIAYGEDVVARLARAMTGPAEAGRLHTLVVDALNRLAADLCRAAGAAPESIIEAVVVGNTAMHHLFLRLPVRQLALAPYEPAVRSALDVPARDAGLRLAPGAAVHLLPNIAGYVGADHVAMLLATGVAQMSGVTLALDIGTNTEVCLANAGELTSISCASGPAFEGAHISCGMRAAAGAIEHVQWNGDRLVYQTIAGAPPAGLCGSGLLDAIAALRRAGALDANGRLGDHPGVRERRGRREFVLVDEGPDRAAIVITQRDVRELQLAKGAMRAGIQVLLESQNLAAAAIEQVIIAGAFGTYIDVSSAVEIGMLPALPLDRCRQVGNAAGAGARLALISRSQRAVAQAIADRVRYIELARVPDFARIFAQAMYLE